MDRWRSSKVIPCTNRGLPHQVEVLLPLLLVDQMRNMLDCECSVAFWQEAYVSLCNIFGAFHMWLIPDRFSFLAVIIAFMLSEFDPIIAFP
ncbi:voltage-gated ion channel superfamily [Corchorus olitorius]|uniref:Voltage-gated ion channel superfamily n=1 Tax=Corchorus olitorius TaxID=93759 RepID=A0A1R3G0H9_9ROSI|nr:voltage-gated ion channel superfamily [Corchorus olitorius]